MHYKTMIQILPKHALGYDFGSSQNDNSIASEGLHPKSTGALEIATLSLSESSIDLPLKNTC